MLTKHYFPVPMAIITQKLISNFKESASALTQLVTRCQQIRFSTSLLGRPKSVNGEVMGRHQAMIFGILTGEHCVFSATRHNIQNLKSGICCQFYWIDIIKLGRCWGDIIIQQPHNRIIVHNFSWVKCFKNVHLSISPSVRPSIRPSVGCPT